MNIYRYEKLEYIWDIYPQLFNDRKTLGFDTHLGCGCHCIYCTYPAITKGCECYRPSHEILDFIIAANNKHIGQLQIVDDIFNSDLSYAKTVCSAIINANNTIPIKCYLSPNIDPEFAMLLKKAGVKEVVMGVDSLSDSILLKMGKDYLESDIFNARRILKRVGIKTVYTFILGGPFETIETLLETKNNVFKHMPDRVTIQYGIRLYPNTPIFNMYSSSDTDYCHPQFIKSTLVSESIIKRVTEEIYSRIGARIML